MNVCTFYESRLGRNDGPPLYWTNAMRKLGIEVDHQSSQDMPKEKFDHHLWVDWGEDALAGILPYKPINVGSLNNTIYIASDTHLGFDYRVEKAEEFKRVYVNQLDAVELFASKGIDANWLPHAVEPQAYPAVPICSKKYDVCFVGFVTFIKRAKFLDKMFKEFPSFYYGQHFFEEAADIYRRSKIVLNTSATDDINMRFFEGWGTGSFTLSEYVLSMNELRLPVEVDLITYKNEKDAIEKIHYYLDDPKGHGARMEISRVMREWVLKNHTYEQRVKQVFRLNESVKDGKENYATVS